MSNQRGKCDVCGTENVLFVACSILGGLSFAYCAPCLQDDREPYGAWVGQMVRWEDYAPEYLPALDASLAVVGRTREQFNADAMAALADYADNGG